MTPLQEFIHWAEMRLDHEPNMIPQYALDKATELLEKEREVIEQAFNHWADGGIPMDKKFRTASDYYTKTFTNESK